MIAYGPRGIEHGRKAMLKLSAKASGSKSARRGVLPWLIVGLYLSAAAGGCRLENPLSDCEPCAARLWFSAHTHTAHATHSTMGPEHAHSLSVEGAHGLAESDEGGPGRQNAQHTNTPHTTLNTTHQNTQHTTPNTQHNAHSTQHSDPKSMFLIARAPLGGPERSTMGPLSEPKVDVLIGRPPLGGPRGAPWGLSPNPKSIF